MASTINFRIYLWPLKEEHFGEGIGPGVLVILPGIWCMSGLNGLGVTNYRVIQVFVHPLGTYAEVGPVTLSQGLASSDAPPTAALMSLFFSADFFESLHTLWLYIDFYVTQLPITILILKYSIIEVGVVVVLKGIFAGEVAKEKISATTVARIYIVWLL